MKEEEMMEIADLMDDALNSKGDVTVLDKVRQQVRALTSKYPLPG
jgi:glycine hydroxymethyltransferase